MQVRKMACVSALLLGASVWFADSARAGDCSELPADVEIECSDAANLSAAQVAFCGIWGEGKWDSVLPHCLAVEKIEPNGAARIVYTWGKAPQWRIHESGFYRTKAAIEGKTLKSKLPSGAVVKYQVKGDKLRGEYRRGQFRNQVVLRRFEK